MVITIGVEPMAASMSTKYSTSELRDHNIDKA